MDSLHASASRPRPLTFYALGDALFEVCWHEPPVAGAQVPESLVQDIWRLQQFRACDLRTTDGRVVEVLDPGRLNRDGGPDFLDARLLLDGRPESGPVEIHTASAAWFDHGHQRDPAYAGISLHVTLEHDLWTGRLRTTTGRVLPEVVLAPILDAPIRTLLYNFYARGSATLPCAGRWSTVDPVLARSWVDRLATDRLAEKVRLLESRYLERPDLDQLLYELVLTGLGYAKNAVPMLELARRVRLGLLHELPSLVDVQAALLGTAGLLPDLQRLRSLSRTDLDFVMLLRDRYAAFHQATGVAQMDPVAWQFFRLRPSNFPALRIAQAAALVCPESNGPLAPGATARLGEAVCTANPRRATEGCFRVDPGPFWHGHVRIDRRARRGFPMLGRQRVRALISNAIAPVLLLHAEHTSDERLAAGVADLLRALPAEDDEVMRTFSAMGTPPRSGFEAQGYHQLYRAFCREGHCLSCDVGRALFAQTATHKDR